MGWAKTLKRVFDIDIQTCQKWFMEDKGGFSSEQAHLEDEAGVSLEKGEDRGTYRDIFLAYSLSYTMRYRLRERGLNFSIEKMREILKRDQYSIMEDQKTKKLYRVSSRLTKPIQDIYDIFGLKRKSKTIQIT